MVEKKVDENIQWKRLNDFVVDIDCLLPLQQYSNALNIFNVLDLKRTEIRHSNMLAWLLSPYKQHGFGDKFLKRMFINLLTQNEVKLSPIDIELMDLSDTIVEKEVSTNIIVKKKPGKIDILLTSQKNKLLCAIENKIDSKEHDKQLTKYSRFLQNKEDYKGWTFILIYLTPDGDEPSDRNWKPLSYTCICEILENLLCNYEINDKAKMYIEDYKELIRREIMIEDEKLKQACENIYAKHTEALDLLFRYIKEKKEENPVAKHIWKCLKERESQGDIKVWGRSSSKGMVFTPMQFLEVYKDFAKETWNSNNYLFGVQIIEVGKGWTARLRINKNGRNGELEALLEKAGKANSTNSRNAVWTEKVFKNTDFEMHEADVALKINEIVDKAIATTKDLLNE